MNKIFLGRPTHNIEERIKDKWCDIFIKKDGTKVRPNYDASKTAVNIYTVEDYQNVRQFSFGKSYSDIDNLYYYDDAHGIDLSRTNIQNFDSLDLDGNHLTSFQLPDSIYGFNTLYLYNNQLTSFQLPDSIQNFDSLDLDSNHLTSFQLPDSIYGFNTLYLYNNQLTSFQLPDSIQNFDSLDLDSNHLTSFQLPDGLLGFRYLTLNNDCILDMSHVSDVSQIPDINDEYGGIYTNYARENTVIKIKDASMESVFKSKQYWDIYQYTWEGK